MPEDVLKQVQIQDVALSPDGETVIYSRRVIAGNRYITNLWMVPWAGGEPRQLTHAVAKDFGPCFSPDGTMVLFISDRGGRPQPWILPLTGGEASLAADISVDTKRATWSPDGKSLLLLAGSGIDRLTVGDPADPTARVVGDFAWRLDAEGFRDQLTSAWIVRLDGSKPLRISDPGWEILDARWTPDGNQVLAVADGEPDAGMRRRTEQAAVWRLDASGNAAPFRIAELPGGVVAVRPGPDGARIAIVGNDHPRQPSWGDAHLHLVEHGGARRLGELLDRPVGNVTTGDLIVREAKVACEWFSDAAIVAQVGDEGRTLPYRFEVVSGAATPIVTGELVCNAIAIANGRIAIVASDRGEPTEVYAIDEGALRRRTWNGSEWLAPYRRDPVPYRVGHPAGHEIELWWIEGRDAPKPGPAVLHIHGGPHAAHGPSPWLEMLALADAGIHVIYPNPRGSSGYGEGFARAAHGNWGDVGSDDVLHAIDWAIEAGMVDPARVGVMGLSHGGYLSTWLLGHYPKRFAAGEAENPVSNWVSWYGGSDLQGYTDERFVGIGTLPDDIDAFLAASPFMSIHRNTAPLLLLQSEADLRCPPEQSETLFAILRQRGVTTQFVRYPGESHFLAGIGRPDRRVDRMRRIVDWFAKYL